eukprot:95317-Hanusia_phi.AAC.1
MEREREREREEECRESEEGGKRMDEEVTFFPAVRDVPWRDDEQVGLEGSHQGSMPAGASILPPLSLLRPPLLDWDAPGGLVQTYGVYGGMSAAVCDEWRV